MYLCAPESIVTAKISKGQSYTESTPASLFYYFGRVGLLMSAVVFGFVNAWIMRMYYYCILENRIVSALCYARLLTVIRNVQHMSGFYLIIARGTIPLLLLLLILILFRISSQKNSIRQWKTVIIK